MFVDPEYVITNASPDEIITALPLANLDVLGESENLLLTCCALISHTVLEKPFLQKPTPPQIRRISEINAERSPSPDRLHPAICVHELASRAISSSKVDESTKFTNHQS